MEPCGDVEDSVYFTPPHRCEGLTHRGGLERDFRTLEGIEASGEGT